MGSFTSRLRHAAFKTVISTRRFVFVVLIIAVCLFVFGCASSSKPKVEAPPAAVVQADEPQQMSKLPPPDTNSVQDAVKRVFKDSAAIDTTHKPAFIAGDFNGDLSQDIAVVLKPVPEKLPDLNEEYPNWMLRDPFSTGESKVPRLGVTADDRLLAVIHGYGANGWRDSQATQTYLLKNAVGSGLEPRKPRDVVAASEGKKMPRLRGDVIGEVVEGTPGFLYYALSSYSWYDPKTFKGDPEPGMFHGTGKKRIKQ